MLKKEEKISPHLEESRKYNLQHTVYKSWMELTVNTVLLPTTKEPL